MSLLLLFSNFMLLRHEKRCYNIYPLYGRILLTKKDTDMKKVFLGALCAAATVGMMGCGGGSPEGVAEDFVQAIIKKDGAKAIEYYDTTAFAGAQDLKNAKDQLEELGKKINDTDLTCEAVRYTMNVPAEKSGYQVKDGIKFTGEDANVYVQFMKGKDKKKDGFKVALVKGDGKWLVTGYVPMDGKFDDSSK